MTYTANNDSVYLRAFIGGMAGMAASGRFLTDPLSADYVAPAEAADAYGQAIDIAWGVTPPTNFELETLQEISEAVWENRSALPRLAVGHGGSNVPIATVAGSYTQVATAIVAAVQRANDQVVLEGIDPNATGGGGGGGGGSGGALGVVRFCDPSNSTGFASDTNTGATANNVPPGSGPILTIAHFNALIAQKNLTADTTFTFMSDDTTGIAFDISTLVIGAFNLVLQGTVTVVHQGGTINAGTVAINPKAANGGQRQTLHTTDIADWTSSIMAWGGGTATRPLRVIDTVTTDTAWLAGVGVDGNGTSPGTATVGRACPPDTQSAAGALTIGDAYQLVHASSLTLATSTAPSGTGSITLNDLEFSTQSIGPLALSQSVQTSVTYNRCAWLGQVLTGGTFNNCAFTDGVAGSWIGTIVAGVHVPVDQHSGILQYVLDTVITSRNGTGLIIGSGNTKEVLVFALGLGDGGMQGLDCRGQNRGAIILNPGGDIQAIGGNPPFDAFVWGNGNQGYGVMIAPAARSWFGQSVTAPSVTGANGDFAFFQTTGPTTAVVAIITVGRAWNNATGAYTEAGGVATRTTTWAHLTAALGSGGFNGSCVCLETQAGIVITGRGP